MFDDYFAMRSTLWALLVVLGACTKPNPASCLDDFCNDPALPFCDADGSIGGTPDTCIAVQCTPAEFKGCRDDRALVCSADGANIDAVDCEFGCGEDGCLPCNTSDCQPPEKHIIPKYLPTVCDDLATGTLEVNAYTELDTSDDTSCTSIVAQPTGPEICVVHHESITIAANRTLTVKGTRAIALVGDRQLAVNGIVDASSNGFNNGPGGGIEKSGIGGDTVNDDIGGGGAGDRTAGGHGATNTVSGGGANGGAARPNPVTLSELFGGTQSTQTTFGAAAGAAGGAVTLICCRCELSVIGTIDVNGGGGSGASQSFSVPAKFFAAAGGGAGGNVVLQGMQISVEGQLFSNGGGGGGGGPITGTVGQDGRRTTECAPGGPAQQNGGGGGAGGCGASGPTNGVAATSPGGGGGSAGFILSYTPQGVTPTIAPFAISPAFEPNGVIATN